MKKRINIFTSVSADFWVLIVFIAIITIILAAVFSTVVYNSYVNKKRQSLPREASKINYILTDSMQYVENYAEFIGKRIAENGTDDIKYIADLLGGDATTVPSSQNLFITTLFDWVSPQKQMLASSNLGVFKEPKDMSFRNYLERTPKHPWTLQLQPPAVGVPSGQWIIPGGMGITDQNGKYLGALTLGFSVDGLANKINAALGSSDIQFMILTKNMEYVSGTLGGDDRDEKHPFISRFKENKDIVAQDSGIFKTPLEFGGVIYTYYQKTSKYDYIMLLGYNKSLPGEMFNEILLPRFMEFLVLGLLVIWRLFIFKKQLIKPIQELSKAAVLISHGDRNVKIPRTPTYETTNLAKQLISLQRYVKKIQRIDQKLYEAKQEADRANKAKSDFLANMSHELRTPLNAIIGYSEMIKMQMLGDVGNDKYIEYAGDINDSGNHLLGLINDILDISKAEAGKLEIREKTVDMARLSVRIVKILGDSSTKKNIILKTEIPDNFPKIIADEMRIKQIIINLMSNAIKFSRHDEPGEVVLSLRYGYEGVVMTIADTGVGIAEEDIPKILKKFGHIKTSMHRQSEGTGLGLWLTKMLVEAHQGKLTMESQLGVGTKVIVTFPRKRILL